MHCSFSQSALMGLCLYRKHHLCHDAKSTWLDQVLHFSYNAVMCAKKNAAQTFSVSGMCTALECILVVCICSGECVSPRVFVMVSVVVSVSHMWSNESATGHMEVWCVSEVHPLPPFISGSLSL